MGSKLKGSHKGDCVLKRLKYMDVHQFVLNLVWDVFCDGTSIDESSWSGVQLKSFLPYD